MPTELLDHRSEGPSEFVEAGDLSVEPLDAMTAPGWARIAWDVITAVGVGGGAGTIVCAFMC
jgi:hypothetical protein